MVKDLDLYELDRFCRALTGRANLPFGGMIIVLAGDFCQLKLVGGSFLFQIPGGADNKRAAGYELYRAITSDAVVVLSKVPGSDLTTFDFVLGFALATQPTLSLAPAVVCPPPFSPRFNAQATRHFPSIFRASRSNSAWQMGQKDPDGTQDAGLSGAPASPGKGKR